MMMQAMVEHHGVCCHRSNLHVKRGKVLARVSRTESLLTRLTDRRGPRKTAEGRVGHERAPSGEVWLLGALAAAMRLPVSLHLGTPCGELQRLSLYLACMFD